MRKCINDALCLRSLNEMASMTTPLQSPSTCSHWWNQDLDLEVRSFYIHNRSIKEFRSKAITTILLQFCRPTSKLRRFHYGRSSSWLYMHAQFSLKKSRHYSQVTRYFRKHRQFLVSARLAWLYTFQSVKWSISGDVYRGF